MSKNDSKLLTKVSSLIPGQVPDFVESDHSLFVKFLKDYYQYLEAGRLTLTATINYITLETTTVSYILSEDGDDNRVCLLYTSPSPRDPSISRMPSSA